MDAKTEVMREFFDGGRFDRWHQACRACFARPKAGAAPTAFATQGYETIRLFAPGTARKVLDRIEARARRLEWVRAVTDHQQVIEEDNPAYLAWLFGHVFAEPVDRRLVEFFGSEYFPFWFSFSRSLPKRDAKSSFLWHRDVAPSAFALLTLYLNPTSEHGGRTETYDLAQTRAIGEAGYAFVSVKERRPEIDDVLATAGISAPPFAGSLDAGEALLFRARDVLHRGVAPDRGMRLVLHVCLLPSPAPWRQAIERWTAGPMSAAAGSWTVDFMPVLAGRPMAAIAS